jgi:hypothetical protein
MFAQKTGVASDEVEEADHLLGFESTRITW